jgi:hypothetical protein
VPEPTAAPPAEKPSQPAVSFTVKAITQPGQGQPATAKPAAASMKPPAGMKPSPVKPRDECEDIKVIGIDECKPAGDEKSRARDESDSIVIVDEGTPPEPASFWKKGKA